MNDMSTARAEGPDDQMAEAKIRLVRTEKTFQVRGQEIEALLPTDLDIRPHEFIALVGPSGCGKSTILDLIAGLMRPTAGQVLYDRRGGDRAEPARRLHDAEGHVAAVANHRGTTSACAGAQITRGAARRGERPRAPDDRASRTEGVREPHAGGAFGRHAQARRDGADADLRAGNAADGRAVRRAGLPSSSC